MAQSSSDRIPPLWATNAECVSFNEALYSLQTGKSLKTWFAEEPLLYWAEHHSAIKRELAAYSGTKVRVPVSSPRQMLSLCRFLPLCFDLVVFSPSLSWPSCRLTPCSEFATSSSGIEPIFVAGPLLELFAWLIAAKPLLDRNRVAFLPIYGSSPHRWGHTDAGNRAGSEQENVNRLPLESGIQAAFAAFCEDLEFSAGMSCRHLLLWPDTPPFVMHPATLNHYSTQCPVMPIRVPRAGRMTLDKFAVLFDDLATEIRQFRDAIKEVEANLAAPIGKGERLAERIEAVNAEFMLPASASLRSAVESIVPPRTADTNVTWEKVLFQVSGPPTTDIPGTTAPESSEPVDVLLGLSQRLSEHVAIPDTSILHAVHLGTAQDR